MENKVDLHIHTNESDGTKTPEEVLIESEKLGLKIISITDHESIEAYSKLNRELFSGIIVPGIELKTYCNGREIELLGYGISIEKMKNNLPILYKSKEENNKSYLKAIIEKLRSNGITFPEDVEKSYTDSSVLPARFITKVISEDKEHFEYNKNIFLADKIEHSKNESLYRGWLSNPQSDLYVEYKGYPNYKETIQLIKNSGGKVFIPHIFQYGEMSKDILKELLSSLQIDGIECYYPTFTEEQTNYLLDVCTRQNLFVSGGSDYHGENKKNELGRGLKNNLYVPEEKVSIWTKIASRNEQGMIKQEKEELEK